MGLLRRSTLLLLATACSACFWVPAASADGVTWDTPVVDGNFYNSPGAVPSFIWMADGLIDVSNCAFTRTQPFATILAEGSCTAMAEEGLSLESSGGGTNTTFTWAMQPMISFDGTYEVSGEIDFLSGQIAGFARAFTLDTTLPLVQLQGLATYETDRTPSFAFTILDANPGTTRCGVDATGPNDNVALNPCPTSPVTMPALPDGPHTFWVVHRDLAGNQAHATTISYIDTTGPQISVGGIQSGQIVTQSTVNLAVSASDAGAGVGSLLCSWGGAPPLPCSDPQFQQVELVDDVHTLLVLALDTVGNASTESVTFTVDTGPGADETPQGTLEAPKAATFKSKRGSLKARRYYKPTFTARFALAEDVISDDCDGEATMLVRRAGKQIGKGKVSFSSSARKCTATASTKLAKKHRGKRITLTLDYKKGPFSPFKLTSKSLKF